MLKEIVTYGEGGYDPDAPDGNVISRETVEVEDVEPTGDTLDPATIEHVKAQLAKAAPATAKALAPLLDALARRPDL